MYMTGHGSFNEHLQKMGLVTSNQCRKCGEFGETAEYLLCECDALSYICYRHFANGFMEPEDFYSFALKDILGFILNADILMDLN